MSAGLLRKGELIVEIGTEEIPPGVLPGALNELKENAARLFRTSRIPAEQIDTYGTPRRMIIHATGIPANQATAVNEILGPPRAAAFNPAGEPTPAAIGFAKSQRVPLKALKTKQTPKGEYVYAVRKDPSQSASKVLRDIVPDLIRSLSFQKTMRWDGEGLRFPRPIRWLVAVLNGKMLPFSLAGLKSSNRSTGHRFLGAKSIPVRNWKSFKRDLARNHVVADPENRKKTIVQGIKRLGASKKGRVNPDRALINEAVFLTEEPVVMAGSFDKKYLKLPQEVPMTAMKEHQGYFPVHNKKGGLLPFFIFVSNGKTKKPALVRAGNERVLRARLEDARFYFIQDQKTRLEDNVDRLNGLVYHDKLGSMYLKKERLCKLALYFSENGKADPDLRQRIERAAVLCKTDLLTGMVREFPALQGIMGREYGKLQGEDREVCEAIAEHYFPRQGDDPDSPKTRTGKYLAAADRLDSLVGFFGADLLPSGSLDPYGLRRQGLGLTQILLDEIFMRFTLSKAVERSVELYQSNGIKFQKDTGRIQKELEAFLSQRMQTFLRRRTEKTQAFRRDLCEAVLAGGIQRPLDAYLRFIALMVIQEQKDFEPLVVSFKRASRILPEGFSGRVQPDHFKETVEKTLYSQFQTVQAKFSGQMNAREYTDALTTLSRLRTPIDRFFDGVMVMDENKAVRENRLSLLSEINGLFRQFGDFTRIIVEEKDKRQT